MKKSINDVVYSNVKVFWGEDPSDFSENTPVIKTNNLSYEGHISYDNLVMRDIDKTKIGDNYLTEGDLLIEKCGGTKTHSVGYVDYFDGPNGKYVANNFILVLRPDRTQIVSRYLFYQMRYFYELGKFSDCYNKTTGIQNLKKNVYLDKTIVVPSLIQQSLISSKLKNLEETILLKRRHINLLDDLIKSRFIGQEVYA